MADAPERIRVAQDADGFWTCREAVSGSQEYVRADLYAALEARLAARTGGVTNEAIAAIWSAAMTAACNIVIHRQNRLNDDDGPDDVLNEQGVIIKAIKEWLVPDDLYISEIRRILSALSPAPEAQQEPDARPSEQAVTDRKFALGDRVTKIKGSSWTGRVVGFYETSLTPIGYCVESENEPGSVQIYPEAALSEAEGGK